jgi:phospholipid/cholesterol/gamma-HCH transport system permease protein
MKKYEIKDNSFFVQIGDKTIQFFVSVFEIAQLVVATFKAVPKLMFYRRQLIDQLYSFSIKTLPIASIISVFVGLASTIQGSYQSTDFIPRYLTISVIFKSTVIELSPVILSLVLAGKIGASIAAELGSMKITEQIDALETLSFDPVAFLVLPRVVAACLMMPIIAIYANFIAMLSSFIGSTVFSDWITVDDFITGLQYNFKAFEVLYGSIYKPAVFGFCVAFIGSYFGLKTTGGARGVGNSVTSAVVLSAIVIVIFDYYLADLLL